MKNQDYWKRHYVLQTSPEDIQRRLTRREFRSAGKRHELVCFERSAQEPSILVSQGSGGDAYVFAELGYHMHRRGYNVFIMPKHGGRTVTGEGRRQRVLDVVSSDRGGERALQLV